MADGMYVANRNIRVATLSGHIFIFKKDEPVYVPPAVRHEMLQYGILPVDGDLPVQEDKPRSSDPVGEERFSLLLEAIAEVVLKNDSDDFTASGMPKNSALEKVAGFNIDTAERSAAWKEFQQARV